MPARYQKIKQGGQLSTAKARVSERHRHRYEFNNDYLKQYENAGLLPIGFNPGNNLVEIVELQRIIPFSSAPQFHPELKSTVANPHPLFINFVAASAMAYALQAIRYVRHTQMDKKIPFTGLFLIMIIMGVSVFLWKPSDTDLKKQAAVIHADSVKKGLLPKQMRWPQRVLIQQKLSLAPAVDPALLKQPFRRKHCWYRENGNTSANA